MEFKTRSGSHYEVDTANRRIRRISGILPGTKRLGTDGSWHRYKSLPLGVRVGEEVLIVWGDDVAPIDPRMQVAAKTTITSAVTEIV